MVEITGRRLEKEKGAGMIPSFIPRYRQLLLELIGLQREELARMRHQNEFTDEILRGEEFELDLEEARMRRKVLSP
jgi:CPA1 family monovalent cation:H+ antiporter